MLNYKIKIIKSDLDLLIDNIRDNVVINTLESAREKGPIVVKEKYTTGKILLTLSAEAVSIILDELGDSFSVKGLDNQCEPNSFGLQIERLIDIFSVGYDE
jgi:hypothetical protein